MSGDHLYRFGGSEFEDDELEAPRRAPSPAAAGDGTWDTTGLGGMEGADESGTIRVRIDGSGMVTDVVIPSNWQDEVAQQELGTALCTAANNAFFGRMADALTGVDIDQQPAPAGAGSPGRGDDPSGQPSPNIDSEVVRGDELVELFARFDRDLMAYRDQLRATVTRTVATHGVNGRIEVRMRPGYVSAVTVDRRWIRYARHTEVRAEAVSAFRSASRQAGTGRPDAVPLPDSLARLQELAGDPRVMGRRIDWASASTTQMPAADRGDRP